MIFKTSQWKNSSGLRPFGSLLAGDRGQKKKTKTKNVFYCGTSFQELNLKRQIVSQKADFKII